MSHSTAAVKFLSDGLILYGEYNGTSDVILPRLYNTSEERDANWRNSDWPYHDKNCKKEEDVIIAVSYGGGFSWQSKACRYCKLITDRFMPFDQNEDNEFERTDGLPEWYPNRDTYYIFDGRKINANTR